ncbi:glycolate oxidase subunit GlcD [Clostridium sp. CAG:510]|nr:glycolate oxidase subunit GlcD [Clostridium sp. CAG:510]
MDKEKLLKKLKEIIPDKKRIVAHDIPEKYLSDTLGRLKGEAAALVFPQSTEEVSKILKYAHKHGIPVTPRGAGTNLVGSTVPVDGGIILDFSHMDKILELDENTMTITVQPGLLLQDLQKYVEERGLFYPPDPGEKASSVGGNISTNAGGMRAVKYGVTRDYVRGLEVVTADGSVLTAGGKNVKDASGLSLKNLYIGSEGTLAVITKCILKLIPKPETSLSVLVPYPDLKTGIRSVLSVLRANANPTAVEFMERKVVKLGEDFLGVKYPYPEAGSYILLTFDGHATEVRENAERIRKLALDGGALAYLPLTDTAQNPSNVIPSAADIWKVRGALVKAVEAFSEQEPVDIVVPIDKTAEFISFINKLDEESGMQMVSFGHAGDGNVHLCVVRGDRDLKTWHKELKANMDKTYHKAYELGGITSGEHGIGISKRRYFLRETSGENLEVMNRIKDALDPKHILNDKKSYILEKK